MDPSIVLFFVSVDNIGTETSVTKSFFMPGAQLRTTPNSIFSSAGVGAERMTAGSPSL